MWSLVAASQPLSVFCPHKVKTTTTRLQNILFWRQQTVWYNGGFQLLFFICGIFLGERRTKDIPSQIVWSNENSHIYSELTTTSESNERATILYSYLGPGMTRRQILCAPRSMWWAVGGVLSCRVYYSEIRFSTTISISLDYPLYLLVMWNYVLGRGCSKWVGLVLV